MPKCDGFETVAGTLKGRADALEGMGYDDSADADSGEEPGTDPATDTERAVYVQRIDPDHREAYVEAHDDVPDAVTDAMERGDVTSFDLFLREDIAVCILEAPDIDAYLDAVEGDEAVAEWERYTGQFKQDGVDADADPEDGIPFMDRIWSFRPDE